MCSVYISAIIYRNEVTHTRCFYATSIATARPFPNGSVKGARMCDCIEKMPVVSRADCTTYSPTGLVACEDNDLRTHYDNEMRRPGGKLKTNLVETCDNEDVL